MALIRCVECGKEISDRADKCPNCGCPLAMQFTGSAGNRQEPIGERIVEKTSTQAQIHKKAKWSSGRLVIGIISTVLFLVIAFQSCAAGAYNTLSNNGDLSGSIGFVCSLIMLTAGIISIVTKNSRKKSGSIVCVVFYWLLSFFASIGAGSFSDLKIWGFVAFAFGLVHLLSMASNVKSVIINCSCAILFFLLTLVLGGASTQPDTTAIKVESENPSTPVSAEVDKNIIKENPIGEPKEERPTGDNNETPLSQEQLEIEEFVYENTIGDTLYFLVIKNNSDYTIQVSTNTTAKDAEGKIIGADTSDLQALGAGNESCIIDYFDGVTGAADFEYTLTIKEEKYYESVIDDLSCEVSQTDEKAIISVKNNSAEAAEFVEATALFFKDGEFIRYDSVYVTDDDSEIKAGETIIKELNCYESYDDVRIYFTGRRTK